MARLEEISQKFISAINRHDAEAVAAMYASDCVVHDPQYPAPLVGRAAVKKEYEDFIRALPDVRFELLTSVEKGDTAGDEIRITGTNTGPLATPMGELPPTNKPVDLGGGTFYRVNADGLVVDERRYYDTATFMRQLGLAPEPAEAAVS